MSKLLIVLLSLLSLVISVNADINVAITEINPMCFKRVDGKKDGFSIDLLNKVTSITGEKFNLTEYRHVSQKLQSVLNSNSQIAICGVTDTLSRSEKMDSIQIMETGIRAMSVIAPWWKSVFKLNIAIMYFQFFILIYIFGILFWLAERKAKNSVVNTIQEGVFLAATTVSTVGYGKLVPVTFKGRNIAIIAMLVGIPFFGAVATNIWANILDERGKFQIENVSEFRDYKVGTVQNTSNYEYLIENKVIPLTYSSPKKLYEALLKGRIDLAIYDEPSILYFTSRNKNVVPVGPTLNIQNYRWFLSNDYSGKKDIELALLKLRENGEFDRLIQKWF